jgi:hypothetical protein
MYAYLQKIKRPNNVDLWEQVNQRATKKNKTNKQSNKKNKQKLNNKKPGQQISANII